MVDLSSSIKWRRVLSSVWRRKCKSYSWQRSISNSCKIFTKNRREKSDRVNHVFEFKKQKKRTHLKIWRKVYWISRYDGKRGNLTWIHKGLKIIYNVCFAGSLVPPFKDNMGLSAFKWDNSSSLLLYWLLRSWKLWVKSYWND